MARSHLLALLFLSKNNSYLACSFLNHKQFAPKHDEPHHVNIHLKRNLAIPLTKSYYDEVEPNTNNVHAYENNLNLAPAFEITYFYLQNTLNLTEDTMWKITFQHGSILGLTVQNIKSKIKFLKRALKLSDDDIKVIISRLPALLSLTPRNIQAKITVLRQKLGIRTLELKDIVLRYPSVLTYSIPNTSQKIDFFIEYLRCTIVQTRKLLINHPEIITYSSSNVHSKVNFLLKEFMGSSIQAANSNDIRIVRTAILSNPMIIGCSLEKNLYPKLFFWKEMLQTKEYPSKNLISMLSKFPIFFNYNTQSIQKIFEYCVEGLGCSAMEFRIMLLKCPRIITHSIEKLKGLVEYITDELELDDNGTQLRRMILHAPQLFCVSNESLRIKVEYLRSLITVDDESNNELLTKVIVGMPTLLLCSIENNLKPKIEYFLEILNDDQEKLIEVVSVQPTLLGYSLEKRIKPRMEKMLGIGGDPRRITVAITLSEDKFENWLLMEQQGYSGKRRGRKMSSIAGYKKEKEENESSDDDPEVKDDSNEDKRIIVWTRPRKLLQ